MCMHARVCVLKLASSFKGAKVHPWRLLSLTLPNCTHFPEVPVNVARLSLYPQSTGNAIGSLRDPETTSKVEYSDVAQRSPRRGGRILCPRLVTSVQW